MELLTAILVLCSGRHFVAMVTANKNCKINTKRHEIVCYDVLRDAIFDGVHPLSIYRSITIHEGNIGSFGTKDWSALSHATYIDVSNTGLEQLPGAADGFGNFPCLSRLEITDNLVEVIPRGAFPNITRSAGLVCPDGNNNNNSNNNNKNGNSYNRGNNYNNNGSSNMINSTASKPPNILVLSNLKVLGLEGNQLTSLPRDLVTGFQELDHLLLSGNPLPCSKDLMYLQHKFQIPYVDCFPLQTVTKKALPFGELTKLSQVAASTPRTKEFGKSTKNESLSTVAAASFISKAKLTDAVLGVIVLCRLQL
ncbi:carboxypeptidase N subunit 2 [Elysia marginata]|uniref:Carboxypeptidase N subunit 2 n=1 Tax=Elysia marginata TaxID=1093978 RepID=A0AAV4IEH0_9GAST|nr:carboxypeptidase N subunit 2 [Elysia marginata]